MTQKALARRIGIDQTTLSRLERRIGSKIFQKVLLKVTDFLRAKA